MIRIGAIGHTDPTESTARLVYGMLVPTLDGDRGAQVRRVTCLDEAADQIVARHSERLLAVRDGRPGGARGGTAHTVAVARTAGSLAVPLRLPGTARRSPEADPRTSMP